MEKKKIQKRVPNKKVKKVNATNSGKAVKKIDPKQRDASKKAPSTEPIIVDESRGFVFADEDLLFKEFGKEIELIDSEYLALRKPTDLTDSEQELLKNELEKTLEEPDIIWKDDDTFKRFPVYHLHRKVMLKQESVTYVTSVYLNDDSPSFIFLHFGSRDPDLIANFSRGEVVYDREWEKFDPASVDGDGLQEGDPLAIGLFQSMMKLRAATDIPIEKFKEMGPLREETVESADEIWRTTDFSGNTLVTFIKEFPDQEEYNDLSYVAVTLEDVNSNVHALLYSFPTNDKTLVDRYRRGENLQAEEISQESSH